MNTSIRQVRCQRVTQSVKVRNAALLILVRNPRRFQIPLELLHPGNAFKNRSPAVFIRANQLFQFIGQFLI